MCGLVYGDFQVSRGFSFLKTTFLTLNFSPSSVSSESFFDIELPGRDNLQTLPVNEDLTWRVNHGIDTCPLHGHFHILALLMERGRYSNHLYMANVNHRPLTFRNIHDTKSKAYRSLYESFLDPETESDRIDMGDGISFCLHAVTKDETIKLGRDNGLRSFGYTKDHHYGFIKDMTVRDMTVKDFKRLLSFFNYKVLDGEGNDISDDSVIDPHWVHALLDKLSKYSLQTEESFMEFLDECNMAPIYQYNSELDLHENVVAFAALMRAVIPVRPGIVEGQHRLLPCILYLYGYYDIVSDIPLKKKHFATVHGIAKNNKVEWQTKLEKAQIWKPLAFHYGIPSKVDERSWEKAFKIYRRFGHEAEDQRGRCMPTTFDNAMISILTFCATELGLDENEHLYDFDNYWAPSKIEDLPLQEFLSKSWDTLLQHLKSSDITERLHPNKNDSAALVNNLGDNFDKIGTMMGRTASQQGGLFAGVGHVFVALNALLRSPKDLNLLVSFFHGVQDVEQKQWNDMTLEDATRFFHKDWLHTFFWGTFIYANKTFFRRKQLLEIWIICRNLRTKANCEQIHVEDCLKARAEMESGKLLPVIFSQNFQGYEELAKKSTNKQDGHKRKQCLQRI